MDNASLFLNFTIMLFDKVNIKQELIKERSLSLATEAKMLLNASAESDANVLQRLKNSDENADSSSLSIADNHEQVFHMNDIEKICIRYRLRFLDTKYFKHEYPYEAILKIKEFEKEYNTKVKRFKIVAPDKAFDLQDCNQDPLLFAQLADGRFYLIHQWGNDLAWYRKFIYFPARTIYTYFYFMLALAALFAFSVPVEWFLVKDDNVMYMRIWFTIHCFIGFFFMGIFLGTIGQKSFSSMNWKSKFMNE